MDSDVLPLMLYAGMCGAAVVAMLWLTYEQDRRNRGD